MTAKRLCAVETCWFRREKGERGREGESVRKESRDEAIMLILICITIHCFIVDVKMLCYANEGA